MASEESIVTRPPRQEPELETVPLAKLTRKTIERLAPFCQMRLPPEAPRAPLVPKINSKILRLIQAVDTSMLLAQIGYRLSSDAASLCDPFASSSQTTSGVKAFAGLSTPEMIQTMAAHGHGHCLKANEAFRDVQQEIFKIAANTKDNESAVLVPSDPQQPATHSITLKEVGTNLVANLSLLERFSRNMTDQTSWWEWLEEELMSPNSTLLPPTNATDADRYARWSKIKGEYLDYYNTIRVVYTRYPQLFTTSSTAWQSISSVPPPPSSPGSSWDGSYEDLGAMVDEAAAEEARKPISASSHDPLKPMKKEGKSGEKENGKDSKRFKDISLKVRLPKLFGKKVKKVKGKGKEKEEVEETSVPGTSGAVEQESSHAFEKAPKSEEIPKSGPLPRLTQESGPIEETKEREDHVFEKDEDIQPVTEQKSLSSTSASDRAEKGGLAKVFVKLKEVLAKLGCQTGSGIES